MPRRLITSPENQRARSLHIAVRWTGTFTVRGPGDVQGEPSLLVDEFVDFIVDCDTVDSRVVRVCEVASTRARGARLNHQEGRRPAGDHPASCGCVSAEGGAALGRAR